VNYWSPNLNPNRYHFHYRYLNPNHCLNRWSSRVYAGVYMSNTDLKPTIHSRAKLKRYTLRHWDLVDTTLTHVQSFCRHTHNDHNGRTASLDATPNHSQGDRRDATPRRNTHVHVLCRGGTSGIHMSDLYLVDTTAACGSIPDKYNQNDYSQACSHVDDPAYHDHMGLY